MQAESWGMLMNRVAGLSGTQVYAPRYYRRFPGPRRLIAARAADRFNWWYKHCSTAGRKSSWWPPATIF